MIVVIRSACQKSRAATQGSTAVAPARIAARPLLIVCLTATHSNGFDASDVAVGNATISQFVGTGTSYTVVVAPGADGLVTVDIRAGAAHDGAGNSTLAARRNPTPCGLRRARCRGKL